MRKSLNLKIKFRKSFRPFACSVFREDVGEWLEVQPDGPNIILIAKVRNGRCRGLADEEKALFGIDQPSMVCSEIRALTHVGYPARYRWCTKG